MSNEKRLQQIRDAARYKYPDERIHFIDGAKWADSHPHWIPVEERLPKEKQKVLVYMPANERCDHEYMCEALYNYAWHKWEDADEPIELEGITHWMEIVPPRKEE